MQDKKITIIGAGIGGLTTALALKQIGFQVTVYEGAAEIKPVGAGIMIANNAMQVFKKLGIHTKIANVGHKITNIKLTDANFDIISSLELDKFEDKYGVFNVAIHRADLLKVLSEEVGLQNIILSKRLTNIKKEEKTFQLIFEDGTVVNSDIVIGADGIRSIVREQLFMSGRIRDTKQRCWRGVKEFDLHSKYNYQAYEAWGKGKRFGFSKTSDDKIYWFAVINEELMKNVDLIELFKEFHPDVLKMISETPKDNIIFNDIIDLKPIPRWHDGKACLIGDAAHATTPNMGQGACQAIEDAYVITKLFEQGKSAEEVFTQYEKIRIKKARSIVNRSWTLGKTAHYKNPILIWLRNRLMKMIPYSFINKQLDKIFNIE